MLYLLDIVFGGSADSPPAPDDTGALSRTQYS